MTILIFAIWLILNGAITSEILLFGGGISLAMFALLHFALGYKLKYELTVIRLFPLMLAYIAVLLWEICKANVKVVRVIAGKREEYSPAVIEVALPLHHHLTQVLLANSITLTPGTVTIDVSGDGVYLIHCLDRSMGDGIEQSTFVKLLAKMEAVMEK